MLRLRPDPVVTDSDLAAGKRALVLDAAWGSASGALSGGVVLAAFALALGADPQLIGLLAALPFIAQAAQLPAIVLIERLRQRRKIGVLALTAARVLLFAIVLIPFLPEMRGALPMLVLLQFLISALGAVGGCAINSWLHQLIPQEGLGDFFSKRLLWGTVLACAGTLVAGQLVDNLPFENPLHAYAIVFAGAAIMGLVSCGYIVRAPEPQMKNAGPPGTLVSKLRVPFGDTNFRQLLVFLGAWNIASNIAAPFLTVYLMRQLGYGLGTVTTLWVTSQLTNALTLYLWGRLSDRLSNKAILAVALPVYFFSTLALVFTRSADDPGLRLALLYGLHVVMGAATGGIALATGNIGLKLAPQGHGTSYLAAIGFVSAVAGGIAPIAAGFIAQGFQASELSAVVRWASPGQSEEVRVFAFAHWEFLFLLSTLLGLYVMHALSRVREGHEISERVVMQEFAFEAMRSLSNQISSIGGALGSLFPFERLAERRGLFGRVGNGRASRP
ncbi:MFS transporter [Caldimonas tepidiphila]|uniref:MFS transporter n=1 Tax=Caldimonas tepidiphila TaxID=2315841 RepID=UPI001472BDD3|nr:MFS transporter [Caldimonas tepidiphila]